MGLRPRSASGREVGLNLRTASTIVIASAAKQSRLPLWQDSGLLRRTSAKLLRNDGERTSELLLQAFHLPQARKQLHPQQRHRDRADAAQHGCRHGAKQCGGDPALELAELVRGVDEEEVHRTDPTAHLVGGRELHQREADHELIVSAAPRTASASTDSHIQDDKANTIVATPNTITA